MSHVRSACDRCHAKKTKCPKHPGASSCIRCAKAGALCSFSPTGQPGGVPPTRSTTFRQYEPPGPLNHSALQPQSTRWEHRWQQPQHHQHQPSPDVSFSDFMNDPFQPWPNSTELPIDPSLATSPEPLVDPNLTPELPMDPTLQLQQEAMDPRLATESMDSTPGLQPEGQQHEHALPEPQPDVQQLSEFFASLDTLYRGFPSNNIHHASKDEVSEWVDTIGSMVNLKSQLESIIDSISELNKLYTTIMKLAAPARGPQETNEECTISDCIHENGFTLDSMPAPSADYALLNVLVACHMKLLDIVEMLLGHGKVCSQLVRQLDMNREPTFDIPEIRVGKFIVTKERAASYFVTFLTDQLSSLREKIGQLGSSSIDPGRCRTQEESVLDLQTRILIGRTDETMKSLLALRDDLTRIGIIQ